jgi:hypothetical protein
MAGRREQRQEGGDQQRLEQREAGAHRTCSRF